MRPESLQGRTCRRVVESQPYCRQLKAIGHGFSAKFVYNRATNFLTGISIKTLRRLAKLSQPLDVVVPKVLIALIVT
jgi:hypothetical protein